MRILEASIVGLFFVLFLTNSCSSTRDTQEKEVFIDQDVAPAQFFENMINNPALDRNPDGEPFAWNASNGGDLFVKGYLAWKDTLWLTYAVKYYDFLLGKMSAAPDAYMGLIGTNYRKGGGLINEEVSDGLVFNVILEFCELVLGDEHLRADYGEKANSYVAFAKRNVVEKWESRGLWIELGEYGDFAFGNDYINPSNPKEWLYDSIEPGMSQKFNIAGKLGLCNLYLYRITKDEYYRALAEKLFFRLKSEFQLFDDHYVWHYWLPFYENDIRYEDNKLIHWSAVHPFRSGYQREEVYQIVEAYHTGVVFSETDIQRIINTNLEVMWDGDMVNPSFRNSNGLSPDTSGIADFRKTHSGNKLANEGRLWPHLMDFSPTVKMLYEKQLDRSDDIKSKIRYAYYHNVQRKESIDFERKKIGDLPVRIKEAPYGNSPDLSIATVIPYIIKQGENSTIITKSVQSGPLEIALYSEDGKTRLKTIYKGEIEGSWDGQLGFRMVKWDGTDPENNQVFKGKYLMRWSFDDKYRVRAIEIIE